MSARRSPFARIVAALLVFALAFWLSFIVAIVDSGRRDDAAHADAIVVLGAAQYEGHPSPVLKARLDHAAELWARGLAPRMIVTGGRGVGDTTSEAAVGMRYLVQRGVPADSISMDTEGLTTSQSMVAVRRFLGKRQSPAVILVSDPFHMLRLSILARRLRMSPMLSPTRTSPISTRAGQQLRYVLAESIKAPYALLIGVR
ncbi:MAG: YdcF family protein [Gemmatimonadaceae bacterium]|nr:YdcF family protein [Gemmatimonadaceae bacterium]